jgi:hypothetical protein
MPSEPISPRPDPVQGLPPVTAPTGKFIAQLFLVPLAIVGGIAVVFFGVFWLLGDMLGGLGGPRTPAQFVDKLDRSNPDVRWRAAADLAQTLLRDDRLASDPQFALDLAERLQRARDAAAPTEQAITTRLEKQPHLGERLSRLVQNQTDRERDAADPEWKALEADWKKLEPDHNYILFLSSSLGNFMLPTSAPLLSELASQEAAEVNVIEALRRRRAVWALANLGENLKRFDRLPPEQQEAILAALETEAGKGGVGRADWAKTAAAMLTDRQAGRRSTRGVAETLVKCSEFGYRSEDKRDPFLRELAGFAMGIWEGTSAENQRMEEALDQLTSDGGQTSPRLDKLFINQEELNQDSLPVTARPGLRVQYNAVAALARRGSDRVRLDRLEEMLDENVQMEMHLLQRRDETRIADEATAYLTVLTALKALTELQTKRPAKVAERPSLRDAVEKLRESKNPLVRAEAERARLALDAKQGERQN